MPQAVQSTQTNEDTQQQDQIAVAPQQEQRATAKLRYLLAQNADPAEISKLLRTNPAEREAMLKLLQQTMGNAYVQRVLAGMQSGAPDESQGGEGQPLPGGLRKKFESSLGADLGGVRVHAGAGAADAARGVGARAYAQGQDINFGEGEYKPQSAEGEHLLAHEVAHTVQQASGSADKQPQKKTMTASGDRHEVEADRAADAMVSGTSFAISEHSGTQVARQSTGEQEFLGALSMVGQFHSDGMVNTEMSRLMRVFPGGVHDLLRQTLYNFMLLSDPTSANLAPINGFKADIHQLLRLCWIGGDTARRALDLIDDHESVEAMMAEGKSPAKIALRRAVKQANEYDTVTQRANANHLIHALEKVELSPFKSTADIESNHVQLQDVGEAKAASHRDTVRTVLEKFATAASDKNGRELHVAVFKPLEGLIGPHGCDNAFARAEALITGKAKANAKGEGGETEPTEKKEGDNFERALQALELAKHLPKVGEAFGPFAEIMANVCKLVDAKDAGDASVAIAKIGAAVFECIKVIVELAASDTEAGAAGGEALEQMGKYIGYGANAASAIKHLVQLYKATNARQRTDAIVGLLGDIPGPIGMAMKISFGTLGWLGSMGNEVRVASKDIALKEFFYADAVVAPDHVPALLKEKMRMIRNLPVDVVGARRTFGMLDPNPADPTESCQQVFLGLEARREWAVAASAIHAKYHQGAELIGTDATRMDWKAPPGNHAMDEARVDAANAIKLAAEAFINHKIRELVKQTGAFEP